MPYAGKPGRQAGCFSSGKPSCRRESLVTERNRSSQSSCPRHELRRDQFRSEHLLPHGHGAHQEDLPASCRCIPAVKRFTKPPSSEFFRPCNSKAEGSHLRLFLGSGLLFLQNPVAAFAAVLFQQADIGHAHAAVHCFKHVIDSQKTDLDSR